jgi:hypothetical protein
MLDMNPEYDEYIEVYGSLDTELLNAIYGCVQASKLWFDLLASILKNLGYTQSATFPCMMHRVQRKKVFIVLIYDDDLKWCYQ